MFLKSRKYFSISFEAFAVMIFEYCVPYFLILEPLWGCLHCKCIKTYWEIFFDLRNMFLNLEYVRKFFSKQENLASLEQFSGLFHKKICLKSKKMRLELEVLSWNRKYFLAKKRYLNIKKISLILIYFLNSSKVFSQKGQERFSQFSFFALRKLFQYFLDLRTYFSKIEKSFWKGFEAFAGWFFQSFLPLQSFANCDNIRYFSHNKKNKFTKKNFLVPSAREFDLKWKHI